MKAATPPAFCTSAMACSASVVLPEDSGPKISTTRPRGSPPTPSARSRPIEPLGTTGMGAGSPRVPEPHDASPFRTASRSRRSPAPAPSPSRSSSTRAPRSSRPRRVQGRPDGRRGSEDGSVERPVLDRLGDVDGARPPRRPPDRRWCAPPAGPCRARAPRARGARPRPPGAAARRRRARRCGAARRPGAGRCRTPPAGRRAPPAAPGPAPPARGPRRCWAARRRRPGAAAGPPGTSTCRSIRSSSGPEMRRRYLSSSCEVQRQARLRSP